MESKKGYKYELAYKGVFGRNRKPKFELVPLVKFSAEPKPLEEVLVLARAALAALKPKGSYYVSVREQPVEVEEWEHEGQVFTTERSECFSDKVLKSGHYSEGAPEGVL